MDKINELLSLNMAGVDIWLIGTWVWIDGDTKPHKDAIKGLSCKWHSKRKKWYWSKPSPFKKRYNDKASFNDLAETYGATTFKTQPKSGMTVS